MTIERILEKLYTRLRVIYINTLIKDVKIGRGTTVRYPFYVRTENDGKVVIGQSCFFNRGFSATALGSIIIGDNTIIGEAVKCYDHNHRFNKQTLIKESGFSVGSIYVGSNVWIGSNVTLLKGTYIEDDCVIGAGCIIDGHVSKGSIVKNKSTQEVEIIQMI